MKPLHLAVSVGTSALALLWTSPVAAQEARDPAIAESLFLGAQACLKKGDWACACEKFAASMSADPSVSTLFNIARCQEHDGKLALAWASLQQALHLNESLVYHEVRRKKLDEYGQKMASELERRVPRLRISIAERPAGLVVRRGGVVVPLPALDEPLRVDPGAHEIVAEAPGWVTVRRSVTLAEGQLVQVTLALSQASPIAPPLPVRPAPVPAPLAPPPAGPPSSAQRTAGLAVGGVGLLALGAAGVLGIVTAVDSSAADGSAACRRPVDTATTLQCNELRGQARHVQTATLATAIAGSVVVGAGVVLWATSPKRTSAARGERAGGWMLTGHPWGSSLRAAF